MAEHAPLYIATTTAWALNILTSTPDVATAAESSPVSSQTLPELISIPKEIKYETVSMPPSKTILGGSPMKPRRGQTIQVKYTMSLNGFENEENKEVKVIDSTRSFFGDFGLEIFAGVGQVIKGGDILLLDMVEGEQRCAIIPPEFAFGSKGIKNAVPENATIYFDVTLEKLKGMPPIDSAALNEWLETHPI